MTDATCTEASKCQRNGCTYTEGIALGHNFVDYTSNNDATCTENGTKTAACTRCTATDTAVEENSKLPHFDGGDGDHLCDNGCDKIADDGCHDVDTDTDHKCDECEKDDITPHADENDDNKCDACGYVLVLDRIENTESGVKIEVPSVGGAILNEGTELNVVPLHTSDISKNTITKIDDHVGGKTNVLSYYDLSLIRNGAAVQLDGKLLVTLPAVQGDYDSIMVIYIADDGSIEECATTVNSNGTVSFETDHFSKYAVVGINYESSTDATAGVKKESSIGAIVGIVIGSVVVAGLGGFAIFWFVIKKKSFEDLIGLFKKNTDSKASDNATENIDGKSESDESENS